MMVVAAVGVVVGQDGLRIGSEGVTSSREGRFAATFEVQAPALCSVIPDLMMGYERARHALGMAAARGASRTCSSPIMDP
jgi:hypothetical protein